MTHGAERNNINSSVPTLLTVVFNPLNRDQSRPSHLTLHTLQSPPLPVHIFHISQWSSAREPQNKYLNDWPDLFLQFPIEGEGGREGRNWLSLKVVVVMRRGVRWVLSGKYRDLIEWWRWRYSHVMAVSTTDLHVVITDLSRFISFNYVDLYNSIVSETF